jgi:hypothetical protein
MWPVNHFVMTRVPASRLAGLACALLFIIATGTSLRGDEGTLLRRTVFASDFGDAADADFDGWPDGWTRRYRAGWPRHVRVRIMPYAEAVTKKPSLKNTSESNADSATTMATPRPRAALDYGNDYKNRSKLTRDYDAPVNNRDELSRPDRQVLAMKFDGGGAAVVGPSVEVWPYFSYELAVDLKSVGVERNMIAVGVDFFDADGNLVRRERSRPYHALSEWTRVGLKNVTTEDPRVKFAAVTCELVEGSPADLRGTVAIGKVELTELPQLRVALKRKGGLFLEGEPIEVACDLSSFREAGARLRFRLRDKKGNQVAEHEELLVKDASETAKVDEKKGVSRRFEWKPPAVEPGYYRIETSLIINGRELMPESTTLAVMSQLPAPPSGEFGWSLRADDRRHQDIDWPSMLTQAGVHWLKVPAWLDPTDEQDLDNLAHLAEKTTLEGINFVGVLDAPPNSTRGGFGEANLYSAAAMLMHPDAWRPTVEPLMMRLSLRIRAWQLGADDDFGYVGFPQARDKIREFRERLARYGSDLRVGIPWRFEREATMEKVPWKFLAFDSAPTLTADELDHYLADASPDADAHRWVSLTPLSESEYPADERVRDLVLRMLATRRHNVQAVFATGPVSNQTGLLTPEGSPTELFLPWRTTAMLVGGCEYIGSVRLPNGSKNLIFRRGKHCVMAVWSDRPTSEHLWLGDNVRQVDLCGKSKEVPLTKTDGIAEHHFQADTEPVFLIGLQPEVLLWNINLSLENSKLASSFGKTQSLPFTIRNDFAESVSGRITWHSDRIGIDGLTTNFRLSSGERRRGQIDFQLSQNASTGQQDLYADVEMRSDKLYQFRAYRNVVVGVDDVEVSVDTVLDAEGNLVVTVKASNHTSRSIDFTCLLYAGPRRRERRRIMNLGPERVSVAFVLPNGKELLDQKLTVKLEEIGGKLQINHPVKLTP